MPITQKEEALVFAAKNGNVKCFEELYKLADSGVYESKKISGSALNFCL